MNPPSVFEAEKIFNEVQKSAKKYSGAQIIIAPPAVFIPTLEKKLKAKNISLGAQNAFFEDTGTYTGQISPLSLNSVGTKYVILGHSESREYGDTSKIVSKKIKAVLKSGMIPIVCIGEMERDHSHHYLTYLKKQIEETFENVPLNLFKKIIIAYEPVWAIGKDAVRDATTDECMEMIIFIKRVLSDEFGRKNTADVRFLYGGSVRPDNASEFLKKGGVNGLLVGRDSLNVKKFLKILDATNE